MNNYKILEFNKIGEPPAKFTRSQSAKEKVQGKLPLPYLHDFEEILSQIKVVAMPTAPQFLEVSKFSPTSKQRKKI